MKTPPLEIARDVEREYADLFTPEARAVLAALARFEPARRTLMQERMQRRAERWATKTRISFLDPNAVIPRTTLTVRDAREGKFAGPEIPQAAPMSATLTPWKPRAANSSAAVARPTRRRTGGG